MPRFCVSLRLKTTIWFRTPLTDWWCIGRLCMGQKRGIEQVIPSLRGSFKNSDQQKRFWLVSTLILLQWAPKIFTICNILLYFILIVNHQLYLWIKKTKFCQPRKLEKSFWLTVKNMILLIVFILPSAMLLSKNIFLKKHRNFFVQNEVEKWTVLEHLLV